MERLHYFDFGGTSQLVTRRGEWAFLLRVADAGAEGVHLDLDLPDGEFGPSVLNPKRCTLAVGKRMRLVMRRIDGTKEHVMIKPELVEDRRVTVRLELPDGVSLAWEDGPGTIAG